MREEWINFARLRFTGSRFESHVLGIQDLPALIDFQKCLVEVAAYLWRRNHPDKTRLPNGFMDSIKIGLTEIVSGSTAVCTAVRVDTTQQNLFPDARELAIQSYDWIITTIQSVRDGRESEFNVSRGLMKLIGQLGSSLQDDEALELSSVDKDTSSPPRVATMTRSIGDSMQKRADVRSRTSVKLEGSIVWVDLKNFDFGIETADGKAHQLPLHPHHKKIALSGLQQERTTTYVANVAVEVDVVGQVVNYLSVNDLQESTTRNLADATDSLLEFFSRLRASESEEDRQLRRQIDLTKIDDVLAEKD